LKTCLTRIEELNTDHETLNNETSNHETLNHETLND